MQERQWRQHKYIRKEGNRYIYPDDLKKTPKQRKLMGSVTDINGNRVPVRGRAATKTIASRSGHYDQDAGERLSPQEYQQKRNRAAAANGVKELYRFDNGSYRQEYGRSKQEFAKDNGAYAKKQLQEKKSKRKAALNSQGSAYSKQKQISRDRADQAKEVREITKMEKAEKRKKALNSQGSSSAQQNAKAQGEFSKKMMKKEKEHDAYNQIQRGTSAQEAAKKQGNYSKSMMRKEKTRRSRTKGSDFVNRRLNSRK